LTFFFNALDRLIFGFGYTQVNSKFGFRQSWRQNFCLFEIGQYSKINVADFRSTKSLDANTAENQILSLLGYSIVLIFLYLLPAMIRGKRKKDNKVMISDESKKRSVHEFRNKIIPFRDDFYLEKKQLIFLC
jgi:hypothetical protein